MNINFSRAIDPTFVGITSLTQVLYVLGIIPGILWLFIVNFVTFKISIETSKLLYNHIILFRNFSQVAVLIQGIIVGGISSTSTIVPQILLRRIFDIPAPIPIPITWYYYPLIAGFIILYISKKFKIKNY